MPDASELPETIPRSTAGPLSPHAGAASPLGHRLMFLLLATLAFVIYAPTTLLPVLRDHCNLVAEEALLTKTVAALEREIEHQEQLAAAFENDPLMNERLAILDLHYRKPGEVVLPVLPAGYAKPPPDPPQPRHDAAKSLQLPDHWPTWALDAEHWANHRGLIKLFLDPTLRPIFLLMSAGLVIAAFVLFAPSNASPNPREPASSEQSRARKQAVSL